MTHQQKLANVKKSLHYLVNVLTDNDYVSIITFSSSINIPVQRTAMRSDSSTLIQHRLRSIHAEGGTNLFAGIMRARECLMTMGAGESRKQGILLLTDGMANEGETGTEPILGLVRSLLAEFPGTSMSCVGYGVDHNSDLLRGIATEGNGSYNVVQTLEDVATVFGDILGSLVSCAFQQVSLKIPAVVGSNFEQLSQYPVDTAEDGSRILRIGDIQDQGDMTIVVRGIPAGTEMSVSGYNIRESRFMTTALTNLDAGDSSISADMILHGKITQLRYNVVNLMERVQQTVMRTGADRSALFADIDRLRGIADEYMSRSGDLPIVGMLIEELEMCRRTLNTPVRQLHATTQLLSQRTSCIAYGRGVRNLSVSGTSPLGDDPIMSPYTAVFSNRYQRAISEGLREQTQTLSSLPGSSMWADDPLLPPSAPLMRTPRILEECESSRVECEDSSESDEE
jgi:hypothetical protein